MSATLVFDDDEYSSSEEQEEVQEDEVDEEEDIETMLKEEIPQQETNEVEEEEEDSGGDVIYQEYLKNEQEFYIAKNSISSHKHKKLIIPRLKKYDDLIIRENEDKDPKKTVRNLLHKIVVKDINLNAIIELLWLQANKNQRRFKTFAMFLYNSFKKESDVIVFEEIQQEMVSNWYSKIEKIGIMNLIYPQKFHEEEERSINFIASPPNIVEGLEQCRKCPSKKTIKYGSQDRRADEGLTWHYTCVVCKHTWKEN